MTKKLVLLFLIISVSQLIIGQPETYVVKRASFTSDKYDEFSPVYYKDGIVFCSNRNMGFSNRTTSQNKGLFKICYIDTTGKADWQSAKLFSKNLTTIFNDGPVTFNTSRDTIYFSRNQDISNKLSDISGQRNKLGIFSASLVDGQWTKIRELRINNEWYNVTTPWLSPDGKKLFFASDKPGGFGGFDLYYCLWKGDRLEDPVNLGPVINTKGNESYPFVNQSGDLLFSSDGIPGGHGGKDIYFSEYSDSTWRTPVCLDEPINSKFDDFGIVTDALMNQGYFSTNRDKSVDIYHFRTNIPQILYNEIQKENNYCFTFADSGQIVIDTTNLKYSWDFGDGVKASGPLVYHCYKGAGKYSVKLNIVERNSGNLFFSKLKYNLELIDYIQPYINSSDVAIMGERLNFDGTKSHLPGYRVISYTWRFDNKDRSFGSTAQHTFNEKGEFLINLELVLQSEISGEMRKTGVSKKILVFTNSREKEAYLAASASSKTSVPEIGKSKNALIKVQYSAESEFQKDAVFNVELYSSRKKVGVDNRMFANVPKKYTITEKYIPDDSVYIYIVDQQMTLMAAYPAYTELRALGIENVKIKTYVLKNPAEKDLQHLIKINGAFADSYFDSSDRLTSNAFIMLDQIVKLMNKYPAIKLEVAVHSDNTGSQETSLTLSQSRARLLIGYLINRGINSRRLVATGFGGSKPIAPNTTERDRKLNRRIDFILLSQ
jgi:outer membrane protein OmpA-like peptidoglycan-associated protein